MNRDEFIGMLDKKGYSYKVEGDKIIVNDKRDISFPFRTTIPSGVVFNNGERVNLGAVTSIPSGVKFNNRGEVSMNKLRKAGIGIKGVNRNLFRLMVKKGMFI